MSTSPNQNPLADDTACTPHSFVRGLYLLSKNFFSEYACVIAAPALLVLFIGGSCLPVVRNYKMGLNDFAWLAVIAFIASIGCGARAYLKPSSRFWTLPAGSFLFLMHMLFSTVTSTLTEAYLIKDESWQGASSVLVKAATWPVQGLLGLLQVVIGGGAVILVGWVLIKLPKAVRATIRHICKAGQPR